MRYFVAGIIVICTTAVACVVNFFYIQNKIDGVLNSLEAAEAFVTSESWGEAAESAEEAYDKWEADRDYYTTVLKHFDIDSVWVSLEQLKKSIGLEDTADAAASIVSARTYLVSIIEAEALSIGNVL